MLLYRWETFYVIVGSSAAALTGLQFVVIALGAQARTIGDAAAVEAFGTPTIVHFCAVLTVAALIATPGQTPVSLALCLCVLGTAGVLYTIFTARRAHRQSVYEPVFEDWLWHVGLPFAGYGVLLVTGIVAFRHPAGALYAVAAFSLLLLFVGIHNAWDSAVYISTHRSE
jgi:hypothetical protein